MRLLLALSVLLEECSVSRSAERLNLTQPTVSNMLVRLRELFRDPLFTRTRHGLVPTSRALALEPELRQILNAVESLVQPQTFDPATSEATVTLSANDYLQVVLVAPAVAAMAKQAPGMRFSVRRAEIEDLVGLMDKGFIDIAVTIPDFSDPRLRDQLLYREAYVVVFRNGHPLASRELGLANFLEYGHAIVSPTAGHFAGPTDDALGSLGLKRRVAISVSSFFTLVGVLKNSDYLALIPERLYRQYANHLQMASPPLAVEGFDVIATWNSRTHVDPVRQWVVAHLLEAANDL